MHLQNDFLNLLQTKFNDCLISNILKTLIKLGVNEKIREINIDNVSSILKRVNIEIDSTCDNRIFFKLSKITILEIDYNYDRFHIKHVKDIENIKNIKDIKDEIEYINNHLPFDLSSN